MPFEMDDWGVDIAIAGSQKGFMLATGMAILAVSPKALAHMETADLPRTFFDFRDMMKANATGGFPYTPPLQLIYGMGESLNMLFEEGLDNVYARHHRLAEGVRRAVAAWGLDLVAQSPDLYSDTVSAIYVPDGFDSNALVEHAEGQVTPPATYAFAKAEETMPGNPAPAYFLGFSLLRSGKPDEARGVWQALLDSSPDDAPWRDDLATRLERLDQLIDLIEAQPIQPDHHCLEVTSEVFQTLKAGGGQAADRACSR